MVTDKVIYHHEHWQLASVDEFARHYWDAAAQRHPMPAMPDRGYRLEDVFAYVSEGRWVVECPSGCGNAVVAPESDPWYICIAPPFVCPGTKGWHRIVYPPDKPKIEAVLLRRPEARGFYAKTRNWKIGETVAQLEAENEVRGIGAGRGRAGRGARDGLD